MSVFSQNRLALLQAEKGKAAMEPTIAKENLIVVAFALGDTFDTSR